MFRRLITRIAAAFPTKAASDRLLPYATLLLATLAAASALIQYGNNTAIARVTATMELHKQFLSDTFRQALKDFNSFNLRIGDVATQARCEFIKEALAKKSLQGPPGLVLDCQAINDGTRADLDSIDVVGDQRARLRDFALSKVRALSLSTDGIAQLDIFYRSVIICVERNNCSGDTASALFARDMVAFVNATCAFDPTAGPDRTTNDEIAHFLVRWKVNKNIYWNRDSGREKLFACSRQRAFEN
jgi:hypothetical protein